MASSSSSVENCRHTAATPPPSYQDALDLLRLGQRSTQKGDASAQHPFSTPSASFGGSLGATAVISHLKKPEEEGGLGPHFLMPPQLQRLYDVIGDPRVEVYFTNRDETITWILLSLNTIKQRRHFLLQKGQPRMLDFAYTYWGMGWTLVCSCDPLTNRIFVRYEGGSNGYERRQNAAFSWSHVPSETHLYSVETFIKMLHMLTTDTAADDTARPTENTVKVLRTAQDYLRALQIDIVNQP